MPPVAATTPSLKFSVALIRPRAVGEQQGEQGAEGQQHRLEHDAADSAASNIAEIAPRKKPSTSAYSGAVTGAHFFLKTVTIARMKPPIGAAPDVEAGTGRCPPA